MIHILKDEIITASAIEFAFESNYIDITLAAILKLRYRVRISAEARRGEARHMAKAGEIKDKGQQLEALHYSRLSARADRKQRSSYPVI